MKITYSKEGYQIILEYPETEIYINAHNIIDARKHFIDMIAFSFDSAVNERLQKTFEKQMEDVKKTCSDISNAVMKCVSDVDHEWECNGISTEGIHYICKKCYAKKTYPQDFNDIEVTL